jgi:hypothetical protein
MQILTMVSWMFLGFCRIVMHEKSPTSFIEVLQVHQHGLKLVTQTMLTTELYPTHCNEAQKCFDDSIQNAQKDFNK